MSSGVPSSIIGVRQGIRIDRLSDIRVGRQGLLFDIVAARTVWNMFFRSRQSVEWPIALSGLAGPFQSVAGVYQSMLDFGRTSSRRADVPRLCHSAANVQVGNLHSLHSFSTASRKLRSHA